jgi:transposase InsO family protein
MSRIVCLHRVPKKIVSDRGTQFTSKFSERLHETLDSQLRFSSTYNPQTDGQTKRVNQKICYELVPCNIEEVGIRVYHMLSSPITTTIKKA